MKNLQKIKQKTRERKRQRVRAKVKGTAKRPRLCVSRSIKHLYIQLIDDLSGHTLCSASDIELGLTKKVGKRKRIVSKVPTKKTMERSSKEAVAYEVGKLIAKKAKVLGISKVIFDRAGLKYHGRLKATAEGAREGGLEF